MGRWNHELGRLVVVALVLGGCPSDPPPRLDAPPAPAPAPTDAFSPFSFGPTMRAAMPLSIELIPIAEVGVAQRRRMRAVVATFDPDRTPPLSLDLWTFTQQGDDDTLAPDGGLTPLIDITGAVPPDTSVLADLRGEMSMPRAVTTTPQGLDFPNASAAFAQLKHDAALAMGWGVRGPEGVASLAAVLRGLDTEVWLSANLPDTLKLLATQPLPFASADEGPHRATLEVRGPEGSVNVELLRKRDGWVVTAVGKPSGMSGASPPT